MYCAQIRSRMPAEEQLRELERKVRRLERTQRALVKATDDSTIIVEEDGIIQSVDDVTLKQFGYTRSELVGENIRVLMNDNHSSKHDGYIKAYLKTGLERVIGKRRELDARRKDGTSFPIELGVAEIESDPGEKRRFAGMICDITTKTEARTKLEQAEQQRLAIMDANKDAMFGLTPKGIIETANKSAALMFGYDSADLLGKPITMLIDKEDVDIVRDELIHGGFKFALPPNFHDDGSDGPSDGGSSFDGSASLVTSGSKGSEYDIAVGRELTGLRRDGSTFPISLDLARMSSSSVPGKTRPCAAFIHDLTLRKAQEAELAKRMAVNEGILQASFDSIFLINERGIIEMVNDAAVMQFGWSREDLVNQNIKKVVGGGHGVKHDEYIKRYLRTGEKRVMGLKRELQAKKKDGTEFPIELGLTEIQTEDGEERRFCGFIKDLTERKKYEADIKQKQRLANGVINASFEAMFAINEKGIIEMVNDAAVKQFQWSEEELIGQNIKVVAGGNHAQRHDEYIKRYLATGEKRVMGKNRELQARRKDGTEFPIELGLTEVQGDEGERRFCGFIKDLTRRKAFEADIKRKQKLTAGIIEASFHAVFTIDERGIIQMVNEEAVRQFGWSREELIGTNISKIAGGVHSKNHDAYIKNYLRTGVKKVMGIKRELVAKRKDGTEFPIELGLTEVKIDGEGEERQFCGFIRNLTKQKAHEKEIIMKENMTKGIIEASLAAVFAIDADGVIKMVNGSAIKEFGWSREEFIGGNINMIMTENDEGEKDDYIKRCIEAGQATDFSKGTELKAKKKNGTVIPVSLGFSQVEYSGNSRLFAAYVNNISEEMKVREMEIESAKAEALLLNMLPEEIALRLKDEKGHIADHYSNVAILFADIVGFTAMSSRMSPVEVVGMLNELFSMFDDIVEKYDLNKVKTIGDCYMVTSHPGVESEKNEATHMCAFGLEMIDALQKYNTKNPHHNLNLRVGINIGPVVAGVVGTKRFLYDLWGDSVNLASRMESTGIPGKIQVTPAVAQLAEDAFIFESRGTVHVKGKGEMETYMLQGPKDTLAPLAPARRRPSRSVLKSGKSSLMTSLRNLRSSKHILDTKIVELEAFLEDDAEHENNGD